MTFISTYFVFTIWLQLNGCITVDFGRRIEHKRQPLNTQLKPSIIPRPNCVKHLIYPSGRVPPSNHTKC